MRKLKISLIANDSTRKTTFMKRKKGVMKKIRELSTLCGVQACGVIYSPYLSVPESWPSREGIEEVVWKFMEMPESARTKKMMNQETYLREKIAKVKDQLDKVALENRRLQLQQCMFDCLEGKMSEYHFDAKDLYDLQGYINQYIDQVTQRSQILEQNGESSSVPPLVDADPLALVVADADPPALVVADADPQALVDEAAVSAASGFYDHMQYQNMNMNQAQQEPVQYQVPAGLHDHTQQGIYNNMTWNQEMPLDLNHNLNLNLDLSSNQYLSQQQSSMAMGMMVGQQMGYEGGHASIPFMDGNYHQRPTVDLAGTSHMPSITTSTSTSTSTSTTGVYAPSYNSNNL